MDYIKVGTVGYRKDSDGTVYQCKVMPYVIGTCIDCVAWKIAGGGEMFTSMHNHGVYKTVEAALDGDISQRIDKELATFDVLECAQRSYTDIEMHDDYHAKAYCIDKDLSVGTRFPKMFYHVSEDGVCAVCDAIENQEAFPHEDEAKASRPQPKVITFDDEPEQEEPQETVCRITVEIPKSMVGRLMDSCDELKVIATE